MAEIVLSASRRTDIPAFYMPWFMNRLDQGFFEITNPYNQKRSRLSIAPRQVHSIVFWSKNYGPFLSQGYARQLAQRGFNLFFNFSINSPHRRLEPNIPPLDQRLRQLSRLADAFSGRHIQWRFDPICFIKKPDGASDNNLDAFESIADHAAQCGVTTCITSFVDLYRKVLRRTSATPGVTLYDPPLADKVSCIARMRSVLASKGMSLQLCCERDLLQVLHPSLSIGPAACIPGHRLMELFGPGISTKKDPGQRTSSGCGCTVSRDIGSYALHPCPHDCLFCYANPSRDRR